MVSDKQFAVKTSTKNKTANRHLTTKKVLSRVVQLCRIIFWSFEILSITCHSVLYLTATTHHYLFINLFNKNNELFS